MLVQGVNDNSEEIESIADILKELKPGKAYLAIPTRPPAERAITAPGEEVINTAYQTLKERLSDVEYLISYEGNAFVCTGNAKDDGRLVRLEYQGNMFYTRRLFTVETRRTFLV